MPTIFLRFQMVNFSRFQDFQGQITLCHGEKHTLFDVFFYKNLAWKKSKFFHDEIIQHFPARFSMVRLRGEDVIEEFLTCLVTGSICWKLVEALDLKASYMGKHGDLVEIILTYWDMIFMGASLCQVCLKLEVPPSFRPFFA